MDSTFDHDPISLKNNEKNCQKSKLKKSKYKDKLKIYSIGKNVDIGHEQTRELLTAGHWISDAENGTFLSSHRIFAQKKQILCLFYVSFEFRIFCLFLLKESHKNACVLLFLSLLFSDIKSIKNLSHVNIKS